MKGATSEAGTITMAKRKRTNEKTMIDITLHRKYTEN
jgi:hypothetical protein